MRLGKLSITWGETAKQEQAQAVMDTLGDPDWARDILKKLPAEDVVKRKQRETKELIDKVICLTCNSNQYIFLSSSKVIMCSRCVSSDHIVLKSK